jgi:hypothetical protein
MAFGLSSIELRLMILGRRMKIKSIFNRTYDGEFIVDPSLPEDIRYKFIFNEDLDTMASKKALRIKVNSISNKENDSHQ